MMAITRTYRVIDGGENPAPNLKPHRAGRNAVLITVATTLVTGAIGIATSRWGGVSKGDYAADRTAEKQEANQRHSELRKDLSDVKGEVTAIRAIIADMKALQDQATEKAKGRRGR